MSLNFKHVLTTGKCLSSRWALVAALVAGTMFNATVRANGLIDPVPNNLVFETILGDTAPLTDTFVLSVPTDVSATAYDVSPSAIEFDTPEVWLTVADAAGEVSGTIDTGSAMTFTVTVNPENLPVGEYTAIIACGDAWGNVTVTLNVALETWVFMAADFTGDGLTDLVATDVDGNCCLWRAVANYQTLEGPVPLGVVGDCPTAGDFDGDNMADPLIVDELGNVYAWFSGAAYAMNGPLALGVQGQPAAGDFDRDGRPDMVIIDDQGNVNVWFSREGYAVRNGPFAFGVQGQPVAGDFDRDGQADLVIVDDQGDAYYWLSRTAYAMNAPLALGIQGQPIAGDFDRDGQADLLDIRNDGAVYLYLSSNGWQLDGPVQLPMPVDQ